MLFYKYSISTVIIVFTVQILLGLPINQTPLCEVFTPKALYGDKVFQTSFVGDRSRFSTCGGVAWFHDDNYLASVNFEGGFICTYKFNKSENQFIPLQTIHHTEEAPLFSAENLSFTSDGKLLAVSMNHSKQVNIYRVSPQTHLIDPEPVAIVRPKDRNVHGVRFSRDDRYLACTAVRGSNLVSIYKLEGYKPEACDTQEISRKLELTPVSTLENRFLTSKPKSLDFSHDDRYVAVVYAVNVVSTPNKARGLIAIYTFDKETGVIAPEPMSVYRSKQKFDGGEDINFSLDDSFVIISEHAQDRIIIHEFDKTRGIIGKKVSEIKNPEAQLSFPHGLNISSDGKYLAVANYGDDKFSLYSIH